MKECIQVNARWRVAAQIRCERRAGEEGSGGVTIADMLTEAKRVTCGVLFITCEKKLRCAKNKASERKCGTKTRLTRSPCGGRTPPRQSRWF